MAFFLGVVVKATTMDLLKTLLKRHVGVTDKRCVVMLYTNERNRAVNNLIEISTMVFSAAGTAGKVAYIVKGMGIVLKHWTV